MQQEDPHVRTKEFRVPTPKTIQYIPCTYGNVYAAYVRENLNEGEFYQDIFQNFLKLHVVVHHTKYKWLIHQLIIILTH